MSSSIDEIKRIYNTYANLVSNLQGCAYCGSVATCIDHVIPYAFVTNVYKKVRTQSKRNKRNILVKSCLQCNGLGSDKLFNNFWEKKQYIAERVYKKYKKLLNSPDWIESDILQLDRDLQLHVYSSEINKKFIRLRLENLNKIEIFGEIVAVVDKN